MSNIVEKVSNIIKNYEKYECESYDDWEFKQFLKSGHSDFKTWHYNNEGSGILYQCYLDEMNSVEIDLLKSIILQLKTIIAEESSHK